MFRFFSLLHKHLYPKNASGDIVPGFIVFMATSTIPLHLPYQTSPKLPSPSLRFNCSWFLGISQFYKNYKNNQNFSFQYGFEDKNGKKNLKKWQCNHFDYAWKSIFFPIKDHFRLYFINLLDYILSRNHFAVGI